MDLSAVVLAGGKGTRMEGVDKGLIEFKGRKMIEWSLALAKPFAERLLISCNRNITDYMSLADAIVCDRIAGSLGPLAGVHAAMEVIDTSALLVLPCDTPLLKADLVERLVAVATENPASIVYLVDEAGAHPLHAIIPVSLKQDLEDYLIDGGRGVQKWYLRHKSVQIKVEGENRQSLSNINTLIELEERDGGEL